MLKRILKDIGLNDKEAEIYLSALKLGQAKVSEIAELAKINRVTAYDVLEKLMQKGFVTFISQKNNQTFLATDPEIIIHSFEKKVKKAKAHIPILKKLSKIKNPLRISYFEGVDELKNIYFDTLDSTTEILNIINEEAIQPIWPTYETDYVAKRIENKIYLRGIAINSLEGHELKSKDDKFFRKIKLVSKEKFGFSNDIMIYDNKIAILSWLSLGGVIIDNAEIAKTHRALFEMAWSL
ncbi:hypothetical protein A2335_00105 [Candidatus Peregrinibacteria bacterium RIFOXYB2_FULL_32_7]|nr:MAG: hypothetical protein A2335_00105 [Candidatus Peregrinibacteria bacterium RIFOXYB2_FULL_32_7]